MKLDFLRTLVIAAVVGCAGVAHAARPPTCGEPSRPPHDHEQARTALTRGEVVPLRRVLEAVERQSPGDILKIELLPAPSGGFFYKLKILARDGRVVKQCRDARTGAVLTTCPDR
jgi:hypothetical protein